MDKLSLNGIYLRGKEKVKEKVDSEEDLKVSVKESNDLKNNAYLQGQIDGIIEEIRKKG